MEKYYVAEKPAATPAKERKKKPPPARPPPARPAPALPKPESKPQYSVRKKRNENYYNVFKGNKILFSFDTKAAAIDKVKELEAPKLNNDFIIFMEGIYKESKKLIESNKDKLEKMLLDDISFPNQYESKLDGLILLDELIQFAKKNEITDEAKAVFMKSLPKSRIQKIQDLLAPAPAPKKESKPKKEAPKKEAPKKPKIAKPTKLQFVEGFQKLPRDEQVELLIKQLENYEPMPYTKTKELFHDLPKLLSMSPSKALPLILKYGITPDELRILYKSKVFDFFPTPNECLDKLFNQLPGAYKKHSTMLEGTAGLGNVSYYFYNKGWDVTSNEYDPQLFKIMSRLLPQKILKTNDDFFKLKYVDVDTLFLNPPFAKHIWVKFLLAGIKLLKKSTTRAQMRNLMFISPAMNWEKKQKYLNWDEIVKPNGTVPRSVFKKYVEELMGHKVNVDKILAGEDEDFDENFKIFFGTQFDLCDGFGGTGMKAALSFFQVE